MGKGRYREAGIFKERSRLPKFLETLEAWIANSHNKNRCQTTYFLKNVIVLPHANFAAASL